MTDTIVEEIPQKKPIKITISQIKADLQNGYTRKINSINYNPEIGSIEEKYNLSKADVDELFKHPILKKLKTIVPKVPSFILIDDTEELPRGFGNPSAAAQERLSKQETIEDPLLERPSMEIPIENSSVNSIEDTNIL